MYLADGMRGSGSKVTESDSDQYHNIGTGMRWQRKYACFIEALCICNDNNLQNEVTLPYMIGR
jgi:hypothetical protein